MTKFRIHHVGIPLKSPETTFLDLRENIGMQHVCSVIYPELSYNIFIGNGCDVSMHLMGDPLYPYQIEFHKKYGGSWDHISLLTDDVDAAYDSLLAKGGIGYHEPNDIIHVRYASVGDPKYGLMFEFMSFRDDLGLGVPKVKAEYEPGELRLGQASIVVPDLYEAEKNYSDIFGFKKVYEHTKDNSGFILMADPYWDEVQHNFLIKFWAGPNAGTRERKILEKKGVRYDAVVLYAEDVGAAYQRVVEKGVHGVVDPVYDEAYGGKVAWITDAENNEFCIIEPVAISEVKQGLETGQVQNSWGL